MKRLLEKWGKTKIKPSLQDKKRFASSLALAFLVHLGIIFFLSKGQNSKQYSLSSKTGSTEFWLTLAPAEQNLPSFPQEPPKKGSFDSPPRSFPMTAANTPFSSLPLSRDDSAKGSSPRKGQGAHCPKAFSSSAGVQNRLSSKKEAQQQATYSRPLASLPPPPYPYEARLLRMEGSVILRLHVFKGRIVFSEIVRSSGYKLLDCLSKSWAETHWHFPSSFTQVILEKITFELEDPQATSLAMN
ncbi:hypothetical protein EM20IM_08000 [Candidatus Methylacidiphilum infernorum]|uniref:TonB C-terminal domain-containing protein n=1 Tax=Candidatus Methylacidiphilum infernorum TaxID=511746 RepID=A0ABX7PTX1_9BACT|nr:energy transducer TonB [Candidatus Methylacidiphilum infernorum]QSR86430.1 hypothetical protein EM20IM_08000 [Candidatus Methylacidiphilum infernorum]